MSRRSQILLVCGCLFVIALEFPRAVQQVQVDLAGPYSLPGLDPDGPRLAETSGEAPTPTATGTTPMPVLRGARPAPAR